MGWKSILLSSLLHAVAWAVIWRVDAPTIRRAPAPAPLEIAVVEVAPAPPPAADPAPRGPEVEARSPAPAPRRRQAAAARPPSPPAGAVSSVAPPAPATEPPPWLKMREAGSEVRVPLPSEIGKVPGAPPSNQLPPGALLGPVRAPKPFVPRAGSRAAELGPRMRPDGDGGFLEDRARFTARIDRDGRIRFRDKGNVQIDSLGGGVGGLTLAGSFDLTDAVLRALGDDPYAYEKMRIMERTREVRARMALEERAEALNDAVRRLPAVLDKVWAHTRWTPAQRRRLLFALWDEVDEDGDDEVRRAGRAVRALIVAFIRRELPAGSADGFTVEELDAMNRARDSRERFDPYSE